MAHYFLASRRIRIMFISGAMIIALCTIVFEACSYWSVPLPTLPGFIADALPIAEKVIKNARPIPAFTTKNYNQEQAIRMIVVGDWGTASAVQKQVAQGMRVCAERSAPQFIISTGDNFYNNGVESADDPQWQTKFEQIYTGKALELPWYAVLGNHDYRLNPLAQVEYHKKNARWNMPAPFYTFSKNVGGVVADFFMIDTDPMQRGKAESIAEQTKWLDAELAKSKATWKIVVGHHMVRSNSVYGDQAFMVKHIKPILDKHHVAVYFCGHDHDIQYIHPPDDKFLSIVSGAGGGARDTNYGETTKFAWTNGGFVYMALTARELYLEFLDADGRVLYAEKFDKPTSAWK